MSALSYLGMLTAAGLAFNFLSFIRLYTRGSSVNRYLETKSGKPAWALITGASGGIGEAFASDLASRGFNVVLHGRSAPKLERVKGELQKQHPSTEFRILVADISLCGDPAKVSFSAILQGVEDVDLTILINNAAANIPRATFGTLDFFTREELKEDIETNVLWPTLLTSTLIPALLRSGPSLVINIGSMADNGTPLLPSYSGCKSYLMAITRELALEMKLEGREVEVLGIRVGEVSGTGMNPHSASLFRPSAKDYVKAVLGKVGSGRKVVVPYWPHRVTEWLSALLPESLGDSFMIKFMREWRREEQTSKAKEL